MDTADNQRPSGIRRLGLFSSLKVPGALVLKIFDVVSELRDVGITVVGGFHSPMEKECLRILLRGSQPVVVCPARTTTGYHYRSEWKKPIEEGRLTLRSDFPDDVRRVTAETATHRNRYVIDLADAVFIAHAEPGGKIEALALEVVEQRTPLYTIVHELNANLMALGAEPISEFTTRPQSWIRE